ncbi:MAG: M3 family oligoendopeptidase, partial [Candidatus Eisenbacteria bacterium]
MSLRRFLAAVVSCALLAFAPASAEERSGIPDRYKWDLRSLYRNDAAWQAAKAAIEKRIPGMSAHKGHLGDSPEAMHRALAHLMDLDRDLARLFTYASQQSDQDARIARNLAMRESADQLNVTFASAAAFMRPELLQLGAEKVRSFVTRDPRLTPYRPYLEDILRRAPHTLSEAEESIVAKAGRLTGAGGTVREVFKNAEMPYPTVLLSDGRPVRLDDAAYTQYRALASRADRESVFKAFWNTHRDYQATLGAALNAQLQAHIFTRDVRKFGSCLEAATFSGNIPPRVYTQLITDVRANLPTLHRYLRLRQRMMKLKELRYSDLYAPIVASVDRKYTPEEAMEMTLAAVAPLGKAYVDTLEKGFKSGWVDWMPNTGKASGAYSTGAYGVHPYQLQNFTGLYDEVGTLAHEAGHSMHT